MPNVKSVPPRYIRSETMAYQDAVIRQLDRINELGIEVGKDLTTNAVMAYETAVRDLHYLLYPTYTSNPYKTKYEELMKGLDATLRSSTKILRMEYLQDLQEWKGWLVKEFSQVDILPASKMNLDIPGSENEDDDREEDNET